MNKETSQTEAVPLDVWLAMLAAASLVRPEFGIISEKDTGESARRTIWESASANQIT